MNLPRFLGCSLAALGLTAAGFAAPSTFEGKVRFEITTGKTALPMTYVIKGDLVRMEVETPGGQTAVMLMDLAKHEMTMLIPQQKMYMVHPLPDPAAAAGPTQAPGNPPDVQRTGQFETILGYKCEKFTVKSGANTAEIWAAEGLGVFLNPGMGGPMGRGRAAPRNAWESELASRGFFPLRVVNRDAEGREVFKMEATAVDTAKPADSLFAPPPDYKKFEMPAMPGMNPFNR
jgi:Domain of unknown function (DUF4412)